jgi:Asp-tRNA(Asn)/Glu-tRNA(Gln) amidotransferase A subunit family amidase
VPDRAIFGGFERVNHVGPITRTVRDAAAVLDVVAGGDDRDRGSLRARSPRSSRRATAM